MISFRGGLLLRDGGHPDDDDLLLAKVGCQSDKSPDDALFFFLKNSPEWMKVPKLTIEELHWQLRVATYDFVVLENSPSKVLFCNIFLAKRREKLFFVGKRWFYLIKTSPQRPKSWAMWGIVVQINVARFARYFVGKKCFCFLWKRDLKNVE